MQHRLDWNRPAQLIRADHVVQFGEGYRQVVGPTIAEGTIDELLEQVHAMSEGDASKAYICNEGGNPVPIAEVEKQARER